MATRSQKLKLGIFLVGTAAAVLALLVAFLGLTFWKSTARYYVLVEDSVEGLERGAPVKVRGVRVGSVGGFELYPGGAPGVRVELDIAPDVRVSSDAKAFLRFQGLTGLKLVDLLEGSPDAPPLPPGSYIPYGEGALQKLSDRADEAVERSLVLLESANVLIGRLSEVAGQIEVGRLNATLGRADELLVELTQAGGALRELTSVAQKELRRTSARTAGTLERVDEFLEGARAVTRELGSSSRDLQGLVRTTQAPLRTAVYNLREASQSFKELGRTLAQDPSSLLFADPPPERDLP